MRILYSVLIVLLLVTTVNGEMNFLKKAFLKNQHLGWHVYGGVVITMLLHKFTSLGGGEIVLITIGISILYELYEYLTDDVYRVYGSQKMYYADSFGDIAGAGLASITIVVFL